MLTEPEPDAHARDAASPCAQAIVLDSALSFLIIDQAGRLAYINPPLATAMGLPAEVPSDRHALFSRLSIRHFRRTGPGTGQASQATGQANPVGSMAADWLKPCVPNGAGHKQARLSPDEPLQALSAVLARILSGESWSGDLMLRSRDGRYCRQQAMLAPIRNQQGWPSSVLGVLRPIADPADSPLLAIEAGMRQADGWAPRYEQRLQDFLATYGNAADELRTRLRHDDPASIRGYLQDLAAQAQAIGSERMASLAKRLVELLDSPTAGIPASILVIFEQQARTLQMAIQGVLANSADRGHSSRPSLPEHAWLDDGPERPWPTEPAASSRT